MFSQTALLQYVFANELDDYFWGYVFRTKLNKLIFFELHDKYEAVYFVNDENKEPRVSRYGRSDNDDFRLKKGIFKSAASQQLSKWMVDLVKRRSVAVVFRLESFCELFDCDEKCLNDLAKLSQSGKFKGSIILLCSHNSDKNLRCFINSSVFDYLHENAVCSLRTENAMENIYSILRSNKQEACVFLNSYDRERLKDMVTMSLVEKKSHYPGEQQLKSIVDYLTLYLNDPVVRMREHRIFKDGFSFICPPYKELYLQIRRDDVWKDLCRRSVDYFKNNPEKADEHAIDAAAGKFHFTYDDDSIKTKCMKLCAPAAIYDIYEDKTIEDMSEIYEKLSRPCNRPINTVISDEINDLLTRLDNARNRSDVKTCSWIISTILFFINYLHSNDSELGNVKILIEFINSYVKLSETYFVLNKSYDPSNPYSEAQKQQIDFTAMKLRSCDEIFEVKKANLIGTDLNEILERIVHSEEYFEEMRTSVITAPAAAGKTSQHTPGSTHWSEAISDDDLLDTSSDS